MTSKDSIQCPLWGESGHDVLYCECLLLTQSGHRGTSGRIGRLYGNAIQIGCGGAACRPLLNRAASVLVNASHLMEPRICL